jgi:hypothetical protein
VNAGSLPNLIVIGAAKGGTTSLHNYLAAHPQIAMSRLKELSFFADRPDLDSLPGLDAFDRERAGRRRGQWSRGIGWYRAQFDFSAPVRGESSPIYTRPGFAYCPDRIAEVLPDVKLVFCARDPVERAISAYRHVHSTGGDPRPVEAALAPGAMYALVSRYGELLERYLALFRPEQLLVVDSADLDSRRAETLAGIFRFVGVDDTFWSVELERRWNTASGHRGARWGVMSRLRRLPGWWRVARLPPQRVRWAVHRATSGADRGDGPAPLVPAEVRERLAAGLADDAARLRTLTGRAFPSWSV